MSVFVHKSVIWFCQCGINESLCI